jgi:MFS family permease
MSAERAGTSYRALLSLPHVLRLFLPATAGRLAYGMLPLAMFFSIADASGSLGTSGLAAAALNVTVVLFGPSRGRLVDRLGRRILPVMAIAYALSTALLLVAAHAGAPLPVLLALGALTGACPPPLGPAMRTAWADLTPEGLLRMRAFSLDAVVEELLFTAGPLLTGLAIAVADPQLAVVLGLALMIGGGTVFGFGPATRPATVPVTGGAADAAEAREGVLRTPGFAPMLITLAGVFCALGLIYIAVPVTAAHVGNPAAAGWLMAGLSAGSAAGGLLFGRRTWATPLALLLPRLTLLLAGLVAALTLAGSVDVLALGLVVTGVLISPSLIMAYALADELAPRSARTRASIWVNTAGNAGVTAGTALAGVLADRVPSWLLYLLAAVTLLATAAGPGRLLARLQRVAKQPSTAAALR